MKAELKKLCKKSNGKSNRPVYVLGCESNCSDDEDNNIYAAEFAWPSNNKTCTCGSLKPIQKNRKIILSLLLMYPNVIAYSMN